MLSSALGSCHPFIESYNSLGSSLGYLGIPKGPFWPKIQCYPIQGQEASFGDKRRPVRALCPPLLDHLHICVHFRKLLFYQVSILSPKWPLILGISPHSPSPSYPHFILLFQPPPSIHGYLFYFPFLVRYFCPQPSTP